MTTMLFSTLSSIRVLLITSPHSAYSLSAICNSDDTSISDSDSPSVNIARNLLSCLMFELSTLIMKRSQSASSPSPCVGSSLLAATSNFKGSLISLSPLRNNFSLMTVSSVFCIAGPAFHISSRNTTSAVGRYPSMLRSYLSESFNLLILTGPNISSGVEKRDIRYSNDFASLNADFNRLATIDFATPGGPSRMMLSPASAARRDKANSVSFSYIPLFNSQRSCCILSFTIATIPDCFYPARSPSVP